MDELRRVWPVQIVRGALLRADGSAVGLVGGGAPAWELLATAERGAVGAAYHRLLLTLDAPLDLYLVDQPPDVTDALATLHARQASAAHPLLVEVLAEMEEYLAQLVAQRSSRAKQAIWAVTVAGSAPVQRDLIRWPARPRAGNPAAVMPTTLTEALARARRLAEALHQLGGAPPPRLLEAEAIARLLYTLADPLRAQHAPLAGPLLDRLRRVITIAPTVATPPGITPPDTRFP